MCASKKYFELSTKKVLRFWVFDAKHSFVFRYLIQCTLYNVQVFIGFLHFHAKKSILRIKIFSYIYMSRVFHPPKKIKSVFAFTDY